MRAVPTLTYPGLVLALAFAAPLYAEQATGDPVNAQTREQQQIRVQDQQQQQIRNRELRRQENRSNCPNGGPGNCQRSGMGPRGAGRPGGRTGMNFGGGKR